MTLIIIISIYVALVFIAYGLVVQYDKNNSKTNFFCAAFLLWATVPFLLLFTFGKWIVSVNENLKDK